MTMNTIKKSTSAAKCAMIAGAMVAMGGENSGTVSGVGGLRLKVTPHTPAAKTREGKVPWEAETDFRSSPALRKAGQGIISDAQAPTRSPTNPSAPSTTRSWETPTKSATASPVYASPAQGGTPMGSCRTQLPPEIKDTRTIPRGSAAAELTEKRLLWESPAVEKPWKAEDMVTLAGGGRIFKGAVNTPPPEAVETRAPWLRPNSGMSQPESAAGAPAPSTVQKENPPSTTRKVRAAPLPLADPPALWLHGSNGDRGRELPGGTSSEEGTSSEDKVMDWMTARTLSHGNLDDQKAILDSHASSSISAAVPEQYVGGTPVGGDDTPDDTVKDKKVSRTLFG